MVSTINLGDAFGKRSPGPWKLKFAKFACVGNIDTGIFPGLELKETFLYIWPHLEDLSGQNFSSFCFNIIQMSKDIQLRN